MTEVLKNILICSGGGILLRAIPFLFTPLTLSILLPEDYGLNALLHSFFSVVAITIGMGLRQVLYVEFFHRKEVQDQRALINDIITLYLFIATPIVVLLFANIRLVNQIIFANKATPLLIVLALMCAFLYFFSELFYQVLMMQGKTFFLTSTQVFVAFISSCLHVGGVFLLKWGVLGMMLAYTLGTHSVTLLGFWLYYKKGYLNTVNIARSINKAQSYLVLGMPIMPSMLFGWALTSCNRWFLRDYANLADVGIYSLADTFGQLYQMVVMIPISNAYIPYLLKQFAQNSDAIEDLERWNKKNMVITLVGFSLLVTGGLFIGGPLLYWILPKHYHETIQYLWLLLMGYIVFTGTYFTIGLIMFFKKVYFHAVALLIPSACNLVFNFLLVPQFKIWGCIVSTLISYAIYFIVTLGYNYYILAHYKELPIFPARKVDEREIPKSDERELSV